MQRPTLPHRSGDLQTPAINVCPSSAHIRHRIADGHDPDTENRNGTIDTTNASRPRNGLGVSNGRAEAPHPMNKQALTEADIHVNFITPALVGVNGLPAAVLSGRKHCLRRVLAWSNNAERSGWTADAPRPGTHRAPPALHWYLGCSGWRRG